MAFPTTVNDQITDLVSQSDSESSASATDDQASTHAAGGAQKAKHADGTHAHLMHADGTHAPAAGEMKPAARHSGAEPAPKAPHDDST